VIDPDLPELIRARRWSVTLEATLTETAEHVADVARRLSRCWLDDRGREWTERLVTLRRALERDADAAAELGRAIDRVADSATASDTDESVHPGTFGPRLGSTTSRRADDDRGVRIPRLNEPEGDGS
jgi:hypothetical protein